MRQKIKNVWTVFSTLAVFAAVTAAHSVIAAEKWTTYVNGRFGYGMEYPDIFGKAKKSDNGDGISLEAEGGEITLSMFGINNIMSRDGAAELAFIKEHVAHIVPDSEAHGKKFCRIAYSDDGGQDGNEHIFHEYRALHGELIAGFTLKYPAEKSARFKPIIARMEKSITFRE